MSCFHFSRVFVTGATGFVGAYLVALLQARGVQVTALARGAAPPGVRTHRGDLLDGDGLTSMFASDDYDAIFHLAGLNASAGTVALYRTNVVGTATLLQAIRNVGRPKMRIVIAGSSSEYGASFDDPITEESVAAPVGDYGVSKLAATRMGLLLHAAMGQAVIVARLFNVIGPGPCANLLHADVARQIAKIEAGSRPAHLQLRDLSSYRDFVDVRDVAEGLAVLAESGAEGQIYNLCTGHATQASQLVEMLRVQARLPVTLETSGGPWRAGDVPFQRGSFAKAAKAVGWRPSIALEKSLTDTLNYWRKAENTAQAALFGSDIPEAFPQ